MRRSANGRPWLHLGWAATLALAATGAVPASGQEQDVAEGTMDPDAAEEMMDQNVAEEMLKGWSVELAPSDGTILRVGRPAVTVLVADPAVADIQLVSDQTLFLFAKTVGRTRVSLVNAEEELLGDVEVVVASPLPAVFAGR